MCSQEVEYYDILRAIAMQAVLSLDEVYSGGGMHEGRSWP